MTTSVAATWAPMTGEQREQFDRDGFIVVPGVLTPDEVRSYASALDRTYLAQADAGKLATDKSLHLLSAVTSNPDLAGLIDHPKAFPWSGRSSAGTSTSTTPTSTCTRR